jgi:hypothetical protein
MWLARTAMYQRSDWQLSPVKLNLFYELSGAGELSLTSQTLMETAIDPRFIGLCR